MSANDDGDVFYSPSEDEKEPGQGRCSILFIKVHLQLHRKPDLVDHFPPVLGQTSDPRRMKTRPPLRVDTRKVCVDANNK